MKTETTKPPTTGDKEAFGHWQAFDKAARLGVKVQDQELWVRNAGVNAIFRDYFTGDKSRNNRTYMAVKVYTRKGGDPINKTVYTARKTGAKFTVYEQR